MSAQGKCAIPRSVHCPTCNVSVWALTITKTDVTLDCGHVIPASMSRGRIVPERVLVVDAPVAPLKKPAPAVKTSKTTPDDKREARRKRRLARLARRKQEAA